MPQNVGYDQPFNQLNSFADLLFTKKFTQTIIGSDFRMI